MPALKLILRRTLASATVNPPWLLFPPPKHHRQSIIPLNSATLCRSTLAKGGARLRVDVAHVKVARGTKSDGLIMGNNNNNRTKRLYMLCTHNNTNSFSSSSSSSSSSSCEERENSARVRVSSSPLVADMGHENNIKGNDAVWAQNGVVSNDDNKNQQPQCSKLLTLPTVLTLARVAAIPFFIATFYVNNWWGTAATTSIFIIAAITDWLDGYLARKMGLGTAFGAFLDPVADKLMVAATLVLLCSRPPETAILGDLPWLFPVPAIAIIGREITMSAVREWAASQNTKLLQAVAVNNLGKWKTATQMTALTILLATRDTSLADPGPLVATGVALLYISAGLAVWSLVVYMRKIWKVLLK